MHCLECGIAIDNGSQFCAECQNRIRVLTPDERENFEGITLVDNSQADSDNESNQQSSNHRVYVKHFNLLPGGIFGKLVVGVIVLGMLIIALPITLFVLGLLLVSWLLRGLRRL